jgi:hypothetical protein
LAYERIAAGLAAIVYGVVQFCIYARTGCVLIMRSGATSCSTSSVAWDLAFAALALAAGIAAIGFEIRAFCSFITRTLNDDDNSKSS